MGVLPLQYKPGENFAERDLEGTESFSITGLAEAIATGFKNGRELLVTAKRADGGETLFRAIARIDTPQEVLYYQHGGILPYVLRQLVGS
jgi:aconitate hydratase